MKRDVMRSIGNVHSRLFGVERALRRTFNGSYFSSELMSF